MKCLWCDHELSGEEFESPHKSDNGDIICDDCYRWEYEESCPICEECFRVDVIKGKTLFLVRDDGHDVDPGIYKVIGFPVYISDMFTQRVVKNNVERIGNIPHEENNLQGWICDECAVKIANYPLFRVGRGEERE